MPKERLMSHDIKRLDEAAGILSKAISILKRGYNPRDINEVTNKLDKIRNDLIRKIDKYDEGVHLNH